jgi:PAS domain S-box-containing protein
MIAALDQAKAGEEELERRVNEETCLLTQANEQLQHEVEQRRETEQALQESENALRESEAHLAKDLADLRRLYQLHARLATESDLHVALDEILDAACEFTGTDRGCVQLLNEDGTRLEVVAQRGYDHDSPFIAHFGCKGFVPGGDVAHAEHAEHCRLLIEDIARFPGLAGTADGAAALADGVCAAQSTPMISRRGETVGVLSTQFRQPHRSGEDELRLIDLLAWTAADFIERHQAEAALRDREARLRAIFDGAYECIGFLSPDGTLLEANRASLKFGNNTREQVVGKPFWDTVWFMHTPGAGEQVREAIRRAAAGEFIRYEAQLRRPTGELLVLDFSLHPVKDEHGKVVLIVPEARNITERKHAEAILRESEARFRALAEASPALIYQVDEQGNAVYFNQRCFDFAGIDTARLLATAWHAIVHPDDLPGYLVNLQEAIRTRTYLQQRVRVKAKDGQWHWFESHGAPWFAADGEYRGHVGIAIDITQAVRAEQELKEADRRKDEFLATLAHELRNPLAPISNAMHLLRHPQGRRAADRITEMVDRQVRHMVRLVDDLMEVSRITRNKIELDRELVPLGDILRQAVETSQPMITRAGHELTLSFPAEPLLLDADRVRLTQVFSNLLNNAAKYTEPGGRIRLSARREDGRAVVSVRDNGIGIPGEQLPHVFEMFSQGRRAGGRSHEGLGIGLTMVHSLVRLHGGTVEAHSRGPGQGSEFVVHLPLACQGPRDSEQESAAASAPAAPLTGRRLLIVDDNRDAADSLGLLLAAEGAQTTVVYDGRSALDALAAIRPHAVILDIGMPGMNGHELARAIRQREAEIAAVRIIALTGWGQQADRARSKECGIDHHLTKPVDLKRLKELLIA